LATIQTKGEPATRVGRRLRRQYLKSAREADPVTAAGAGGRDGSIGAIQYLLLRPDGEYILGLDGNFLHLHNIGLSARQHILRIGGLQAFAVDAKSNLEGGLRFENLEYSEEALQLSRRVSPCGLTVPSYLRGVVTHLDEGGGANVKPWEF